MKLHIIRPLTNRTETIAWIELNTTVGNFIIQKGHAPTLLSLAPNHEIIFKLDSGKNETLHVQKGFANITRDSVTILLNK